jgi:hypothetical protein
VDPGASLAIGRYSQLCGEVRDIAFLEASSLTFHVNVQERIYRISLYARYKP